MKIYCCNCQKFTDCELATGKEIYPNRPDLADKNFYRCKCGGYIGCHPNSDRPLGNIPTQEMKKARTQKSELEYKRIGQIYCKRRSKMRFEKINFLRLEDKESYKMKDGQNPVVQPDDYGIRPAG